MVERIQPDELDELARSWGFSVEPEEAEQLLVVAEAVFQSFDLLESQQPASTAPVDAVREPGRPPGADEDPLNAIVRFCRVRAESHEGVLSGKRVAVKDAVAIAGIPLTCGSRILQGYVPAEDSVVADRVLRADGEVVAITNMDDLAFSGGGESSWYGPTLNPWDHARTAGGSSSGSAAALFYDGIDVAIGGDQGGSIRAPASWCGVLGLKPTHGLVPYVGIAGIDHTFDHCGPLARTTADLAALLQAIAGRHEGDPRQGDVPTTDDVAAVEQATDCSPARASASSPRALPRRSESSPRWRKRCERQSSGLGRRAGAGRDLAARAPAGGRHRLHRLRRGDDTPDGDRGQLVLVARPLLGRFRPGARLRPRRARPGSLTSDEGDVDRRPMASIALRGRPVRESAEPASLAARLILHCALADVDALLLPTTPWRAHELEPEPTLADKVLRGWANLSTRTRPT